MDLDFGNAGRRFFLATMLVACGSFSGCGSSEPPTFQPAEVEKYAELSFLKTTQHAKLRDELSRIEAASGTPLQLAEATSPENDLARELLAIIPPDQFKRLASDIDRLWPEGRFSMSPLVRQQTAEALRKHEERVTALRELLAKSGKTFRFPFRQGLAADTKFIEAARLAARLEGLSAAEGIFLRESPRISDAIASLDRMLEWSARLGAVKHSLPRLAAAELRSDALAVLAAIAQHPSAADGDLQQLQILAERELLRWPPDSDAWIGERAVALHAYEMIRDGQLLSFLSIEEIAEVRKKGSVHALGESVKANLAHDEYFYLTEMHELIAACRQPFHERAALLRELEKRIRSLESTPEHPYVAARILLPGISAGHRRQAEDLARWTQWAIALAEATGQTSAAARLDPISGQEFIVSREATRIVVARHRRGGERPAIVPIVRQPAATARRP